MRGISKLYVFCQIAILCIGVHARPSKDSSLLKNLFTHGLSERDANDEGKAFQEWATKEQSSNNEDSEHIVDDNMNDGDYEGEDDGDYKDDDQGDDDGDYEDDDQGEDDGDYEDDDYEGEKDGEDNDEYNDDKDFKDDLPENEIVHKNDETNENGQHAKDKTSKDEDPFNFEDDPSGPISASDGIYRINSHNGTINSTYEEDIKLDPSRVEEVAEWGKENNISKRMARKNKNRDYRWPRGVLLYRIDRNSGDESYGHSREKLEAAIAEYALKTCITFQEVEQGTGGYHVRLMSGGGCYSYVGRVFGARGFSQSQDVSIGNGCNWRGIIVHEFLHALGFWHEQSRPDRDNYVRILWENVMGGRTNNNFEQHTTENTKDLNVEYDYESVMHYGETAFGISGRTTIQRLQGSGSLGQPYYGGLSVKDAEELNRFYECNTPGTAAPSPTTPSTSPPTTPSTNPPTTPSTTPPPTVASDQGVRVFIKSVGCNDRGVINCDASEAEIRVNDVLIPCPIRKGACIAILDGITGKREETTNEELTANLANYLRSLQPEKLILGTVKGTWSPALRNRLYLRNLRTALYRIGVSGRRVYYRNAPFAFIGWSGPGRISVSEGISTRRGRGPSVISKKIYFPLA